mgnify:CR=1 FL=1
MISRFKEFIRYMSDSYLTRGSKPGFIIDSFAMDDRFRIYVMYHTNRYDINNNMRIEDFYSEYFNYLNRNQIKICTILISYKKIYEQFSVQEDSAREIVYRLARKEIKDYEH